MFEPTPEEVFILRVTGFVVAIFWIVFFASIKPSEYQRAYIWFVSLPVIRQFRSHLTADPPLFGERVGTKSPRKMPNFVAPPLGLMDSILPFRVAFLVCWVLLMSPYWLYWGIKQVYLFSNATAGVRRDVVDVPEFLDAESLLRDASAGQKLSKAGRKGSRIKRAATEDRNSKIRKEADKLLKSGRTWRDVSGILHRRFSSLPGYPTSRRQYRNIVADFRNSNSANSPSDDDR